MCDYDVNNIGFYLPDGSYEAMFDPEQDFARLIREHICEAAEISFRKFLKKYYRIENCPQNQIVVPISELDHSYNEPIDGACEEKDEWKIWMI